MGSFRNIYRVDRLGKPICIIPARGGSKRIPHKNIKDFCGKPIIAYSIQNALESKIDFGREVPPNNPKSSHDFKKESSTTSFAKSSSDFSVDFSLNPIPHPDALFSHIVVSTDDEKIAQIAQQYGASVPFMRPSNLANDTTATLPVVAHALDSLRNLGVSIAAHTPVCVLYPTAPLIDCSHIVRSFEAFLRANRQWDCQYLFFANELEKNPLRAFELESKDFSSKSADFMSDLGGEFGKPKMFFKQYESVRSQDLPRVYADAGVLYWGRAQSFIAQIPIFSANSLALAIDCAYAQDIDTFSDWEIASEKFLALPNRANKPAK